MEYCPKCMKKRGIDEQETRVKLMHYFITKNKKEYTCPLCGNTYELAVLAKK